MTIRAPFDGVIIARHTELGQWIGEGNAVAEMLATSVFEAWLDVPQRHVQAVSRRGLVVPVRVEAVERTYQAGGARVIREVDPLARTFSLVMRIEDDDQVLSPGMSVIALLPIGEMVDQLTLHKDAVMRNESGAFVYAVRSGEGGEQAAAVAVNVLFEIEDRVVVRCDELAPGDRVIVEGNERLRPGAAVRIVEFEEANVRIEGGDERVLPRRGERVRAAKRQAEAHGREQFGVSA
jgi:RND family efflux transporter MFP subunit